MTRNGYVMVGLLALAGYLLWRNRAKESTASETTNPAVGCQSVAPTSKYQRIGSALGNVFEQGLKIVQEVSPRTA